jgi:hypothetical protein
MQTALVYLYYFTNQCLLYFFNQNSFAHGRKITKIANCTFEPTHDKIRIY